MANALNLDNGGEQFNICLEANGNLNFKANDENCGGDTKLTINNDSGNVGIGTTNPQSLLQVGDGLAGGYRAWMTRGLKVAWNTDNVFLGLKDEGADRKDSVLAWGDNTNDAFRFIFVDNVSGAPVDGQEIMRLQANGNVGIGTTSPGAKLEVEGNETVARFYNPDHDASILVESGRSNESYLRFKNMDTGVNAWMVGMDDDEQFKIAYGSGQEIRSADTKLYVDQSGNVGIGTTSPTQRLVVNGNVQANNVTVPSDIRYKEDIATLDSSLNKVLSMRGVRYQLKSEEFPQQEFNDDSQIGFIGQELESILPEVVFTDSKGYKSLDYSRLTPVLVEAIKEQQQVIEQQKSALGEALAKIAQLEVAMQKINADS